LTEPVHKQLTFIIGIGRSGTTLLNKILNSHPSLHALPEANFFVFFLNDYRNVTRFKPEQIEAIFEEIRIFALSHPLVGWDLDMEAAKAKVLQIVRERELGYEELGKIIYSEFKVTGFDKSDAKILIDKNPAFTLVAQHIADYLPNAKFIWLVRDYRANVLSRKQNAYLKSPAVPYNAIRWKVFNNIAWKFYNRNRERVLLLRYEDMVSEYEASIKKVYDFLGVDPGDALQAENKAAVDMSTIQVDEKHKKYFTKKYADLARPVNTSRTNAWQSELSKEEIEICDAICADSASVVGYKEFTPVSFAKKAGITLKHIGVITMSWLDIKKDQLLFFVPASVKMKQLIRRHADLGFIRSSSPKEQA
jgi:hypothetical protein